MRLSRYAIVALFVYLLAPAIVGAEGTRPAETTPGKARYQEWKRRLLEQQPQYRGIPVYHMNVTVRRVDETKAEVKFGVAGTGSAISYSMRGVKLGPVEKDERTVSAAGERSETLQGSSQLDEFYEPTAVVGVTPVADALEIVIDFKNSGGYGATIILPLESEPRSMQASGGPVAGRPSRISQRPMVQFASSFSVSSADPALADCSWWCLRCCFGGVDTCNCTCKCTTATNPSLNCTNCTISGQECLNPLDCGLSPGCDPCL